MKLENTPENKARFFALYWGQGIMKEDGKYGVNTYKVGYLDEGREEQWLQLTPLSQISDEDAIEVARLVYQRPKTTFKVVKRYDAPFGIHVEWTDNINCTYHISINSRGNINANLHFGEYQGSKAESYKHNIGENDLTSSQPVPYVAITDLLRSRGYYVGDGTEVEYGWVVLKTT